MPTTGFPQDKEFELSLLLKSNHDFKEMVEYLDTYIKLVLDRFEMSQETYRALYQELINDVPIAAEKYLQSHGRKKEYKFSAYFSWYASERINRTLGLKRKAK